MKLFSLIPAFLGLVLLTGCVSMPPAHDYTAFRATNPASVIILPPINNTPEVLAPYSVMSQLAAQSQNLDSMFSLWQ